MGVLFIILSVIALLIVLLFISVLRIRLILNTDKSELNMTLIWLDPVIKAFVTIENTVPVLKVFLFGKLVFERKIKRGARKGRGVELVKLSNPQDVHVNVRYGFKDPFTTGIACGAINVASQLINIDSLVQIPDFMSTDDYIYLDATAKVNIGSTLLRFFRSRRQ